MNKTVFMLISIALLLFMFFVPNYCAPMRLMAKASGSFPIEN